MRASLATVALWLLGSSTALSQADDWIVLPTTEVEDAPWLARTVDSIDSELRKQGIGVWSSSRAVSAFEQRGSSAPSVLSTASRSAWKDDSHAALRQLAKGDYEDARDALIDLQARSNRALDQLNRDPTEAQRVLDTCLYLVRAYVELRDGRGAEAQARECVGMAPGIEPTRYMHPPPVVDLYEEAVRPNPKEAAALLVESEPSGCSVRLNGISVGNTPVEVGALQPGSYRVQLECDSTRPGRVHPIELAPGSTAMFLVDRFDQAFRATPVLHLRYTEQTGDAERARDARELGRVLPAAAVVLARASSDETLELRLVGGTRKEAPFARIAMATDGPTDDDVGRAVATLLSGECRDLTGEAPVTLDCGTGAVAASTAPEQPEGATPRARTPRGQFISGVSLAAGGAASLIAGYALLVVRNRAGDDWVSDRGSLAAQSRWVNLGTGLTVTGAVGGAMLVAAMPLALPRARKTPWWGWLTGGVGLGLGAASIALAVTAEPKPSTSCTINTLAPEPCVDRAGRTDLALLLGATAAPLVTIPLVYLFRKKDKRLDADLRPGIAVRRGAATITMGGAF